MNWLRRPTKVGSGDGDLDQTSDQLTLCYVRLDIQLQISIDRGSDGLTLYHPKLVEKIEDRWPLRKHGTIRSIKYFYSEKVLELLHVFHFESAGEQLLDMFNIRSMLSSNDQIVRIRFKICEKDRIKYTIQKQKTTNGQENRDDTQHTVLRGIPSTGKTTGTNIFQYTIGEYMRRLDYNTLPTDCISHTGLLASAIPQLWCRSLTLTLILSLSVYTTTK